MSRPNRQFSQTKTAEIPRSSFDLSHDLKTTLDGGYLVPILSLEVLPGDTINCRASLFGRLATPIKPLLDNMYLETFFFFVPWRQTWTNFVKFMGEQENPGDSIDFTIPQCQGANPQGSQSLWDYFGLPPDIVPTGRNVSVLPFRAYTQIYNFWFRDENLIDSVPVSLADGPEQVNSYSLQRRRKRRDYLTSALPFPQKGPAVTIDLAGTAPVAVDTAVAGSQFISLEDQADGNQRLITTNDPSGAALVGADQALFAPMYVDLTQSTGFTINDLRESFQIQKLLERDARGGTRFPEILMSHYRVSDPGLLVHQRPLFLGGGHSRINVTPVQQNTQSTDEGAGNPNLANTPQGNLAAYATVSGNRHGFTQSFTEHGIVIGLVNLRADLTYQQGIERYWTRRTRYDFYWPALAHLGEQAIFNQEIYVSQDATDSEVFGYIPRYEEYRFKQSQITGLFRSSAAASLDVWHLAQDFAALPGLNKAFIEDNPPIDRVVAVPTEPDLLLDVFFKIKAARPLPLFATPGLIDHF